MQLLITSGSAEALPISLPKASTTPSCAFVPNLKLLLY